jgi:nuclear pore complex protein Nup88
VAHALLIAQLHPLHLPTRQDGSSSAADALPPALRTITPSPPLELTAAHFALNRSGTYAAVAGSALEEPETSRLAIVDLTNCRPAAHGSGGGRRDVCDAVQLDPELFACRPGLRVLQIGWHPESDTHLAVLTSDNTWRLYNTQRADLAEQTFELQLRGRCGGGAAPSFHSASRLAALQRQPGLSVAAPPLRCRRARNGARGPLPSAGAAWG